MRGASLSDVKEILGHADMKMTMRYAHLSPAHLRRAVDKLDGLTTTVPVVNANPFVLADRSRSGAAGRDAP
jgi:hypothetical protein